MLWFLIFWDLNPWGSAVPVLSSLVESNTIYRLFSAISWSSHWHAGEWMACERNQPLPPGLMIDPAWSIVLYREVATVNVAFGPGSLLLRLFNWLLAGMKTINHWSQGLHMSVKKNKNKTKFISITHSAQSNAPYISTEIRRERVKKDKKKDENKTNKLHFLIGMPFYAYIDCNGG